MKQQQSALNQAMYFFYYQRFTYINAEDPGEYAVPDVEPVHIWSRTRTDIAKIRKTFLHQWLFASIELYILIFLISTLYLGAGHNPNRYTRNLDVAVVDFDNDLASYYFLNAFRQSGPGNLSLNWRYKDQTDYDNNVDNARRDVENGYVWASVVLRPNTTRYINQTLAAFLNSSTPLNSPFAAISPILVTYETGRNSFTVSNFVLPPIRAAIAIATAQYGQMLRQQLIGTLSSSPNSSTNRTVQLFNTFQLGSLLADPLAATYQDFHPSSPYVGQLATTLGYIYLYLVSGLIVGGAIKFIGPFVGKIYYLDLLAYRIFNGIFQAFIISLIYSLIVLWFFGIHSGSLFMRYWMFNWLSVLVFGLLIVLFTVNLGPIANSVLTAFVILMLAGSTIQISLELSPRFYRYGYGLPLYHIINGGRHLLFNSHERFALSVGVLLVYFGVFWLVAIITSTIWIKKQERKLLEEKQKTKTDKRRR